MKQPVLVLALIAAAWLLIEPLLHWFVRWQLQPLRSAVEWAVLAVLALVVIHSAQRRKAAWCGAFSALAVALNPLWRLDMPIRTAGVIGVGAGVLLAIYALRRWK